jgi:GT2 family glycosyltransferase
LALETQKHASQPVDVSVIVPTYHRELQVVDAVRSALSQSGPSLEVLVLDDEPRGSARTGLESIGDRRLRYIVRPENSGGRPAVVRNEGAKLARGRYLHFLDDDDLLKPRALAALTGHLDAAPDVGMAFGQIIPFGDGPDLHSNRRHYREAARVAREARSPRMLAAHLMFHPALLITSACMARRESFEAVGGFDTIMPVCEDTDLWARIARQKGFIFVDQPICDYHTGAGSLMQSLVAGDGRMRSSYQRMHAKYRAQHGLLELYALKIWARTTSRFGRTSREKYRPGSEARAEP